MIFAAVMQQYSRLTGPKLSFNASAHVIFADEFYATAAGTRRRGGCAGTETGTAP